MKDFKNKKGFTLVEIIVTIAIIGIAMLPLSAVFTGALDATRETKMQLELTQQAQRYTELLKAVDVGVLKALDDDTATVDDVTFTIRDQGNSNSLRNLGFPDMISNHKARISIDKDFTSYNVTSTHPDDARTYDTNIMIEKNGATANIKIDDVQKDYHPAIGSAVLTVSFINLSADKTTYTLKAELPDGTILFEKSDVPVLTGTQMNRIQVVFDQNIEIRVDNQINQSIGVDTFQIGTDSSTCTVSVISGIVVKSFGNTDYNKNDTILYRIKVNIFREDDDILTTTPVVSINTTKME